MIVLVPGRMKPADRAGHHDYLAGCSLLAFLLRQTPGAAAAVLDAPENDDLLDAARSLVFYTGGGSKHALLESEQRRRRIETSVERGAGIVLIHQAIRFPPELAALGATWMGGTHGAESGRGHWRTQHGEFPSHAVMRGVTPWRIRDGWLNGIRFVDGMAGVTPLVWSGRRYRGSSRGGDADIVSWAYERPRGGRSFCFTGIDCHSAWSVAGIRQLLVNAILWSAGFDIPPSGAPCAAGGATLASFLTPRSSKTERFFDRWLRRIR
jgi:hypothetical protein